MENITIIKVRRGSAEIKYCACDKSGTPIMGFNKLSDIRKHWQREIKCGNVKLVRELDKTPNLENINKTIKIIKNYLSIYEKSGK